MLARETRVQAPALDLFSDTPLFNTKAVVHQTSVPAPTLRAWERRYGILTPRRGENDYRLYSERDIATVSWLRERVEAGMTISQAIALLKSIEPKKRRGKRPLTPPQLAGREQGAPTAQETTSAGVGRLALEDLGAALIDHFIALDEVSARRVLAQALSVHTLEDVCLNLFTPVLAKIGRLWSEGAISVSIEHFASSTIRWQLENLFHVAPNGQSGPLVLVGAAPSELHEIGGLMVALFLRRAGIRVVYLGQRVEPQSLAQTALSSHAAAVALSAAQRAQAQELIALRASLSRQLNPPPLFFFGGQGFSDDEELAREAGDSLLVANAVDAAREIQTRLPAQW